MRERARRRQPPLWLREVRRALLLNLVNPWVTHYTPDEVAQYFTARAGLPYHFEGESSPIVDLMASRRRGFAACADAAAAIGAAAIKNNIDAALCIEAPRSLLTYTHVRVVLEADPRPRTLDPYRANRARVGRSCQWVADFVDLAQGRYRLIPAAAA